MTQPFRVLLVAIGALALSFGTPALAQDDAAAASDAATEGFPRDAYLVDTVDLARWSDSEVTVKQLAKGDKVEIVAENGDMTRVRKGTTFGWVASAMLTDTPPEGLGLDLGGLSLPPSLGAPPTSGAAGGE